MRWQFEWLYRLGLLTLLLTAGWSVWVEAQAPANTNNPTNGVAGQVANVINHWHEQPLSLTFGLDQVDFLRKTTLMDQPLWKYLAFLIFIILAFYVAQLIDKLVNIWLKRWNEQAPTEQHQLLLDLLHGPVKMVAFVSFLHIGLSLFDWPFYAQLILSRILIVLVACSVTYLALKLVDLLLGVWQEQIISTQDKNFATQLIPLVSKMAKAGLIIAAVLLTADNLGVKITSALAGLSVGGLALGLAAQDTVANLFGAVAIFLDKPFHLGDLIRVEGVEGTVESIGLRSTRVRNADGHHVSIPNKLMGNAIITNITRRPTIKSQINLGLTYDTPASQVARAVALLEEIFGRRPNTTGLIISFNKFCDSALNILVVHEWKGTDAREHFAELQLINLEIKARFDAERIEFAFPTQTLYLKADSSVNQTLPKV